MLAADEAATKEGDGLIDTNFDDASLSLYAAELGENMSTDEDAAFHEIEKERERHKVELLQEIEKKIDDAK